MKTSQSVDFDEATLHEIEQIADEVADALLQKQSPDPLISKELAKNQCRDDAKKQLCDFIGIHVLGFTHLHSALHLLAKQDATVQLEPLLQQVNHLSECVKSYYAKPKKNSLRQVAELSDATMDAFNKAAGLFYQNNEFDRAAAIYEFLSIVDPSEQAFYLGLANCKYFCKEYEEARRIYQLLMQWDPNNPQYAFYNAHCHYCQNQIEEAVKSLEELAKNFHDPDIQEQAEALKFYFTTQKHR